VGALTRQDHTVIGGRFCAPRPLDGLEGPASGLPFLGMTLGERQHRAFLEAGIDLHEGTVGTDAPPPPTDRLRLLVREDVAIAHKAVERFLEAARREGRDIAWRAGGRVGNIASEVALGFPDEPWLVALQPGSEATPERVAACPFVDVEVDERLVEFPLPPGQFEADVLELPLSESLVLPCGHWVQLLWANLLGLGPFLYRSLGGRNILEMGARLARALLVARSSDPGRVMAVYQRVGDQCRIHPSAVVESSWLADGVEIGANAVVRGCVLAEGASVEPLAIVEGSVLGAGATVQRQAMVKYSVIGNRAHAAGDMQLGLLDSRASLKKTAALLDQSVGGAVRVLAWGRLVRAPLGFAGVGVGAGTVVGANAFVAAGRTVPAGIVVVPAPETVLRHIPEALEPGAYAIQEGSLVAVHTQR